ncbi:IclR family transcriptional regulator [Cupriavidus basilensis]|uniref:IclR family transcriptional regulator n=1 Tax=Cupriavidus basilensis TaxID=68895 RepID=UPI0020A6766D|nr:helix-turn-helix domain-containing protein [Cupriavidus basilensis]MCP3018370.1 helix-turn-helix domain-containing protein [Cupriavidus basilensis]
MPDPQPYSAPVSDPDSDPDSHPDSRAKSPSSRELTHSTGQFTRQTGGSQSLERGLMLLRAFRVGSSSLTNADLAARTGLPRPTVSRLTRSLVDGGFLRYDATERAYRLAAVVVSLADAFHHATTVPDIALPLMRKIAEAEKVNVGLAVPDQTAMVYLAAVRHSRDSVSRTRRVAPGTRVPMELTSIGMAWLAAVPAGVRDHFLARIEEKAGDEWPALHKELSRGIAQAQAQGYCSANYQPGHLTAVGAAFHGPDHQWYGLNISFPHKPSEKPRDVARYAPLLLGLIEKIGASCGAEDGME